jgi:hypothetical protein
MSDETIMECEKEIKRAGILNLIRAGDVVWNTAVGDEGNVGEPLPLFANVASNIDCSVLQVDLCGTETISLYVD